jgi:hypothetical protein
MKTVTLKMTWKWGGSKIITCSSALSIEEVAEEHGFAAIGDISAVFISRGRILAPEFTLHAYKIQDGQTIIAYIPSQPKQSSAPIIPPLAISEFSPMFLYDTLEIIEAGEAARNADQDFANWEIFSTFPGLLNEMMTLIESEEQLHRFPGRPEKTIIMPGTQISEAPLPELITPEPLWFQGSRVAFCDFS